MNERTKLTGSEIPSPSPSRISLHLASRISHLAHISLSPFLFLSFHFDSTAFFLLLTLTGRGKWEGHRQPAKRIAQSKAKPRMLMLMLMLILHLPCVPCPTYLPTVPPPPPSSLLPLLPPPPPSALPYTEPVSSTCI